MTQHGFEATTMKQIARAANLGDATIYKYFPSKEKLVVGYFEQAVSDALALSQQANGWDDFTLQEPQLLIDSFWKSCSRTASSWPWRANRGTCAAADAGARHALASLRSSRPSFQMLDQAQASG
ncbi:MAG: helix-turn-helix transcriptional regulator [Rhodoferax sp.]|nr:helix-turn-helix transcriptional regulator [Rhodoferax sp.]